MRSNASQSRASRSRPHRSSTSPRTSRQASRTIAREQDFAGRPASVEGVVVELVRMIHDASPTALRAVATSGAAGLVLEGTGGGHVPPPLLKVLDAVLATGMPVVLATRCQGGGPLTRTYGMPGGEIDLIDRGLIPAGNLSGQKARLRLLVGLAAGREPAELFPVG